MVGRSVAHYQLTEKLGAGGMGEIYLAQDTRLSRTVAIKALPDSQTADPERRRRFLQEARAASALNHPNIITIHDVVFEGDTAFMVMEFVGGQTLAEKIAAGAMSVSEVVEYGIQIADALAAAHDAGIIHRDLKPGNVMITPRGLVKLLDFGLAKRSVFASSAAASGETTATVGAALTVEGSILGTVSYMSPEQAEGRTVDGRSDIFSFGVVLYEMLTGRRPFNGDSTLSILSSILRDDARQVSQYAAHVPRPIDELVRRCLAKRPEERWQNMHELRDALAGVKAGPPAPPPRQERVPKLAVAAVGSAFLVGAVVWFTIGSRRPGPQAAPEPTAATMPAQPDILTNEHVITMLRANVPAAVITQQIRSARTNFDLSVGSVIRLTEAGAGADLIETMRDPKRPTATPSLSKANSFAPTATIPKAPAPPTAPAAPAETAPRTSSSPAPTVAVTVPDAFPFKIELAEDVPADAQPGRQIHFTVSEELRIGESVVVPLHAEVVGEIVGAEKKRLIGGSRLTFRLKTAAAAGGAVLNVRSNPSERETRRALESASGPKPPKGLAAVIGTKYLAYTAGQQTVQLAK